MYDRIKTIKQCYKALEYEINKQEALEKISTLHYELKIKNDFPDRLLQTTTLIKKNLPLFKSACNHVDIVTTMYNCLQNISVELMFGNISPDITVEIIYMMSFTCEELEILLFLKAALIDNSNMIVVDKRCKVLFSNFAIEMIILGDSDLYAVISYLRITPFLLLKIKIFVQESIKEKFLWLMNKYFNTYSNVCLQIFIFHTQKELLILPSNHICIYMMSIWSEDVTAAKKLAIELRRDITFINAHLEFCSNITISYKVASSFFNLIHSDSMVCKTNEEDKINPNEYIGTVYNLFYNGIWQKPVKNTYWIHNGNTYAQATEEDMLRCIRSAEEAFKDWSTWSIDSRKKILENLASTLECNGKLLLAETILKWIKLSKIYNLLHCPLQNERLEIIWFYGPKGIVSILHEEEVMLFAYLTLSLIIGNCVIVLCNKKVCTLAPYFNMFSTAEIPPGVINLLSNRDMCDSVFSDITYTEIEVHKFCTSVNHIILPLK